MKRLSTPDASARAVGYARAVCALNDADLPWQSLEHDLLGSLAALWSAIAFCLHEIRWPELKTHNAEPARNTQPETVEL